MALLSPEQAKEWMLGAIQKLAAMETKYGAWGVSHKYGKRVSYHICRSVYKDGKSVAVQWLKNSRGRRLTFFDESNAQAEAIRANLADEGQL